MARHLAVVRVLRIKMNGKFLFFLLALFLFTHFRQVSIVSKSSTHATGDQSLARRPSTMKEESDSILENNFAAQCIAEGIRADSRAIESARTARVVLGEQWGDVHAFIGKTRAHARCTVSAVTPPVERPGEGSMAITVELSPAAAEDAALDQCREQDAELRGIAERCVRGALDTEALCVVAGKCVWKVALHVAVLDDAGNAADVAVLAALASLLHARRPDVTVVGRDVTVHTEDEREPLPLPVHHIPVAVSFGLFRAKELGDPDVAVLDPTRREEFAAAGTITIACNAQGEVCAVYKAGGLPVHPEVVVRCAEIAEGRARELTKLLADTLKDAAKQHPLATARPLMSAPEPVAYKREEEDVEMLSGSGAWNETPAVDGALPAEDVAPPAVNRTETNGKKESKAEPMEVGKDAMTDDVVVVAEKISRTGRKRSKKRR